MDAIAKFKETALSVLPVMGIVAGLGLFAVPREAAEPFWLGRFALSGVLLMVGLAVFLLGVDLGIEPFGERVGEALAKRRSLPWLLGAAALVGVVVTAAEPDVQVFSAQVRSAMPSVGRSTLVLSIAVGVGLFMALGMLRSVIGTRLKPVLCVCYGVLLALALAAPQEFVGVAFDAGGATTGPMTVPFVMALGLGVAASRGGGDGGFGLTGIASAGPVMAVLALAVATAHGGSGTAAESAATGEAAIVAPVAFFTPFIDTAGRAVRDAAVSIAPLLALLAFFRLTLLDMTARQTIRTVIGLVYAFAGLSAFLLGVEGGFVRAGEILGSAMGAGAAGSIAATALLLATGAALGAIVVCAEPAVWVLGDKVEEFSGGAIRRRTLLVFLAGATAFAIALAMARAVAGFSLAWVLLPGYAIAFCLMAKAPERWTAVAFDSGGVASGPLTTTFVLSFALGAAEGAAGGGKGASDPFGVVALVAMAPLVAVQWMGIAVERRRSKSREARK